MPQKNKAGCSYSGLRQLKATERNLSKSIAKIDTKSWNPLSSIVAEGESSGPVSYNYTHTTPPNDENLYRLRMIDKDGAFTFSNIVSLLFDRGPNVILYPNPASNMIKLANGGNGNWAGIKEVKILDLKGNIVLSPIKLISDEIDVSQLTTGSFILSVTDKNGQIHHVKFVLSK